MVGSPVIMLPSSLRGPARARQRVQQSTESNSMAGGNKAFRGRPVAVLGTASGIARDGAGIQLKS